MKGERVRTRQSLRQARVCPQLFHHVSLAASNDVVARYAEVVYLVGRPSADALLAASVACACVTVTWVSCEALRSCQQESPSVPNPSLTRRSAPARYHLAFDQRHAQ